MSATSLAPATAVDLNSACVELGLVTPQPTLPAVQTVRVGKGYRDVQRFSESGSFSAIKERIRLTEKLKGKALAKRANEEFFKDKPSRKVYCVAVLQKALDDGYVPDHATIGKDTMAIKLRKAKVEATRAEISLDSVLAGFKALSAADQQLLLAGVTPVAAPAPAPAA